MTTIASADPGSSRDELHAVPTTYEGIRFRSRLEARWAYVLNQFLRGRWEYEPRSFGWPDRGYLPDFHAHLPDGLNVWVEVKPLAFGEELMRMDTVTAEHFVPGGRVSGETGDAFVAVFGLPTLDLFGAGFWAWRTWPNAAGQTPLPWTTRRETGCCREITDPPWPGADSYGESTFTPACGRCVECVGFGAHRLRFRDDGTHYLWNGRTGTKRARRTRGGSR